MLAWVQKLASTMPTLMMKAPDKEMSLTFSTLLIIGLTKMLPLQVRPLPMVPTRDTRASCPSAPPMLVSGEV